MRGILWGRFSLLVGMAMRNITLSGGPDIRRTRQAIPAPHA